MTQQSTLTHTVTALFDDASAATSAIDRLIGMGIARSAIDLSGGNETPGPERERLTFWRKLEAFLIPDDDRHEYVEGLSRGGYLVTVSGLTVDQQLAAADILDMDGSVDISERSAAWRSEGWSPTPTGLVSDASEFANSMFDRPSGLIEPKPGLSPHTPTSVEASPSDDIEVPVVSDILRTATRLPGSEKKRVRIYTIEEVDVEQPQHPNPGSTTLF